MRSSLGPICALALGVALAGGEARAQQATECQPGTDAPAGATPGPSERARAYDVVVDVPDLCVERLRLDVDNLQAHLSLDARVANLVRLNAGADVGIGQVSLGIDGVRAEALLLVDLDNVVTIVESALTFIDENPEIVTQLVGTVRNTVGTVGQVANTALQPGGVLSQTVNTLGQTVQRTLDASGNILERTLDASGTLLSSRTVGRLLDLPVLQETTNAAGQTLRQVRDASGALLELTLDSAGNLVGSRVLQPAR